MGKVQKVATKRLSKAFSCKGTLRDCGLLNLPKQQPKVSLLICLKYRGPIYALEKDYKEKWLEMGQQHLQSENRG